MFFFLAELFGDSNLEAFPRLKNWLFDAFLAILYSKTKVLSAKTRGKFDIHMLFSCLMYPVVFGVIVCLFSCWTKWDPKTYSNCGDLVRKNLMVCPITLQNGVFTVEMFNSREGIRRSGKESFQKSGRSSVETSPTSEVESTACSGQERHSGLTRPIFS